MPQNLTPSTQFIITSRGSRLLYCMGHTYYVNCRRRQNKSRVLWYCSCRRSKRCFASILTLDDRVVGQAPKHTHPPKLPLDII
uniref:SFRICE_001925 n=1 Tax=Spodoptera frugiperda TaxID=7108 RepID=A0A2H1W298_SPOFR